jgi:sphingomyelin phosphodiesterase
MKNTRVIAYNSQNCYVYNFYIIGQINDPGNQFEWLENLLRQMEKDGEIAIFIGHMSPGIADCVSEVSDRLRVLFDRFQHIIRLNLFGHTHSEEFEVVRSYGDNKPIGVNHLTSSMTTSHNRNPSFRVITLDAETKLPLKIETFSMDIEEANKDDEKAVFTKHHELKEDFAMKNLSPNSFLDLTDKFRTDKKTCIKYKSNMYAGGPGFTPTSDSCDEGARRFLSCHTANSVFSEARTCMNWIDLLEIETVESLLFDYLVGKWVNKNNAA